MHEIALTPKCRKAVMDHLSRYAFVNSRLAEASSKESRRHCASALTKFIPDCTRNE